MYTDSCILASVCVYSHTMSEIQHAQPPVGVGFWSYFSSLLSSEYIMSPFSNSKDGSGRRKTNVPVLVFFQSCNVFILLRSQ